MAVAFELKQIRWGKIRSWHAIKIAYEYPNLGHHTYCGRKVYGEWEEDLPATEKSCESCLRIIARRADQA